MLFQNAGHAVFSGSPAEVMFQHQHASLPLNLLQVVPQPVVVLLEVLLEKDPARRFQSPTELLKAIPTIASAIDARRRMTRQSLRKTASAYSPLGTRKPPARLAPSHLTSPPIPSASCGKISPNPDANPQSSAVFVRSHRGSDLCPST
jgi:hypothetical protein